MPVTGSAALVVIRTPVLPLLHDEVTKDFSVAVIDQRNLGSSRNWLAFLNRLDGLTGCHQMLGHLTACHGRVMDELVDLRHRRSCRLGLDLHPDHKDCQSRQNCRAYAANDFFHGEFFASASVQSSFLSARNFAT